MTESEAESAAASEADDGAGADPPARADSAGESAGEDTERAARGTYVTMTPSATYRLQLRPDFPFSLAEKSVPYLAALGVSHLHLSPVLEAVPGSTHGYDVVDHASVRAELGGEEGLRQLARRAREHGLGIVLDIVPNHMAMSPRHNRVLREVLRQGESSPYARWFDIDWAAGDGKILLPVLPGPVGGELGAMRVEDGELHHGEQRFPSRRARRGCRCPGCWTPSTTGSPGGAWPVRN